MSIKQRYIHIPYSKYILFIYLFIATALSIVTTLVTFSQSTYSVNENVGFAQLVLFLNMSLSTDITIQVTSVDVTATGKYCIHIK